ncbi:la-related protein 7-like isoform X2 [Ylistrum balloti]|uniref:la-related protein 7-like isoform X2 n=1 Tax=Ylistrum balloti TaxID=509963 RepID=UPI002905BFA0|nr:la-related protein 7-like isoform X2 [Ylistrum balloti]
MEEGSEGTGKKPRKRMKSLYNNIRDQIEFYFSDSNLHRDRFMKKVITGNEDGYVDISLFMNFNKVKTLTTDISALQKSLKSSKKLQVSDDGQKVKRIRPLEEPKQIDERTVYVECLPHHVDHTWVKRIFSACGEVLYVSIPRYKTTGDSKGFAFVEFDTVEAAKKACEELNNPPVEADGQPGKFPKTRKQLLQLQRKLGTRDPTHRQVEDSEGLETGLLPCESKDSKENSKPGESPTKLSKRHKRRRRQTSESSVDGAELSPMKRRKTVSIESDSKSKIETNTDVMGDKNGDTSNKAKLIEETKLPDSVENRSSKSKEKDTQSEEEENEKPKKAKKRKSKTLSDVSITEVDTCVGVDESEAKKPKLSEGQGSDVSSSEVKKEEDLSSNETKKRKAEETSGGDEKPSAKKAKLTPLKKRKRKKKKQKGKDVPELRVISKKEWLDLRSEYLSLQKKSMTDLKMTLSKIRKDGDESNKAQMDHKENSDTNTLPVPQTRPKVEFIPGVIVKVNSSHPFTRKQIKEFFGEEGGVAYVDLIDGDSSGYIRFKDEESAKKATNARPEVYTFSQIQGEDESMYWSKLQSDREAKLNNKNKSKKRGTQRLVDKAQKINKENVQRKHIVFDD